MGHRGTQLDTQYRFLTEKSRGQIDASFLNNDKITDNSRHQLHYQQHTRFTSDLNMDIDLQDVSDSEYFDDFNATDRKQMLGISFPETNHKQSLLESFTGKYRLLVQQINKYLTHSRTCSYRSCSCEKKAHQEEHEEKPGWPEVQLPPFVTFVAS